jgi:hypothetical protein
MCAIEDAAAIRDFYTLDDIGNESPQALEKDLAKVERGLAGALTEVLQSGAITSGKTHAQLIQLVSLMRFRVPASKDFIENSLRQIVRSTGKLLERRGELPPVPKGFEHELRMDRLLIEISNWKCLEYMISMAADLDLLGVLASMTPELLRVPEELFLLTCDQPVAFYHPSAGPNDAYGIGPTHSAVEISFPLSSRLLLFLSWNAERRTENILSSAEVDEFNRRTVIMADSFIFAPRESESALKTVERYRKYFAGSESDVLESDDGGILVARFRPVLAPDRYED